MELQSSSKYFEKNNKSSRVRHDRKTLISVFVYLLSTIVNFFFCRGDWALGCVPVQFWDFANISLFPKFLNLKSYGNSWSTSYVRFLVQNIEFRFTWGEWYVYQNFVKFQVVMQRTGVPGSVISLGKNQNIQTEIVKVWPRFYLYIKNGFRIIATSVFRHRKPCTRGVFRTQSNIEGGTFLRK